MVVLGLVREFGYGGLDKGTRSDAWALGGGSRSLVDGLMCGSIGRSIEYIRWAVEDEP